ncbi:hypothetical protein KIN20_003556 [Parelaphostrongylus tenuis]|uniref:Uncharacterized protein n=1 Tax=Parelaphostrongylus tenuis TaxID=148309 RepID=A0AAD5MFT4_PARTN|nr:hypothetical protein KIN20_003556 [Parelaphostrongylus tenuis]
MDGTDEKMVPKCEASPSSATVDTSASHVAVAPQRPVKVAPSKAEERIQDISSDSMIIGRWQVTSMLNHVNRRTTTYKIGRVLHEKSTKVAMFVLHYGKEFSRQHQHKAILPVSHRTTE